MELCLVVSEVKHLDRQTDTHDLYTCFLNALDAKKYVKQNTLMNNFAMNCILH